MSLTPIVAPVAATAYRLDLVSADGVTLDLTAGASTLGAANSFAWRPNGTRLFAAESTGGATAPRLHYWDLLTAWDVSSASYVTSTALGAVTYSYDAMAFNADGTEVSLGRGNSMDTYTLSSAYGGTASLLRSASIEADNALFFNSDGTEMFYLSDLAFTSNPLHVRTLSTPYDISTAGSEGTEQTFTTVRGASIARNGTRLIVADGSDVKEYGGNAFDIAGHTLRETFAVGGTPKFAAYSGNGRKLHVLNGNTITQYSTVN